LLKSTAELVQANKAHLHQQARNGPVWYPFLTAAAAAIDLFHINIVTMLTAHPLKVFFNYHGGIEYHPHLNSIDRSWYNHINSLVFRENEAKPGPCVWLPLKKTRLNQNSSPTQGRGRGKLIHEKEGQQQGEDAQHKGERWH
jgi:hypothetical protein